MYALHHGEMGFFGDDMPGKEMSAGCWVAAVRLVAG